MSTFILIGLGGILGANARFWISQWTADRYGVAFPYGTFVVNASGSCVMGLILTLFSGRTLESPEARYLVATGFLGAYTTFSTFAYETVALVRQAEVRLALINLLGTTVVGVIGAIFGSRVGEALVSWGA